MPTPNLLKRRSAGVAMVIETSICSEFWHRDDAAECISGTRRANAKPIVVVILLDRIGCAIDIKRLVRCGLGHLVGGCSGAKIWKILSVFAATSFQPL